METVMKDFYLVMWIATAITAVIFLYGTWRKWRLIKLGRKEERPKMWGARIKALLSFGLIQKGTLKEAFPGVFHSFIFWGFVVLAIGTTVVAIQEDLFVRVLVDELYLYGGPPGALQTVRDEAEEAGQSQGRRCCPRGAPAHPAHWILRTRVAGSPQRPES
jgi:hypothetical protein